MTGVRNYFSKPIERKRRINMVYKGSLISYKHHLAISVGLFRFEDRSASSLVVSLGKALNGIASSTLEWLNR